MVFGGKLGWFRGLRGGGGPVAVFVFGVRCRGPGHELGVFVGVGGAGARELGHGGSGSRYVGARLTSQGRSGSGGGRARLDNGGVINGGGDGFTAEEVTDTVARMKSGSSQ